MECKCGCGQVVTTGRQYTSGHNLKYLKRTPEHCRKISEAQIRAWQTKRERMPIGSNNYDSYGYVRVKVELGAGRWICEHILVMEQYLNRKLNSGEGVHHINGIRDDNRLKNLFLCKNKSEHKKIEDSCKALVLQMYQAGLVKFNGVEKRYEMV